MNTTTRSTQRRKTCAPAVALALLGIGAALPPGALAQGRTDTIMLTGQLAPGTGAGTFSGLFSPVFNASGQTAFFSSITGGSNDQGIFRSDSGSTLTAIARAGVSGGQSAPGVGGGTFGNLDAFPALNASGQTAFFSSITGGSNTQGIFRSDSGSTLTAIARAGQSAPAVGGGTFSSLGAFPVLNASGQTAFYSSISGGTNTQGIFRSDSGSTLTAIARAGQSAPGAAGGTFSILSPSAVLNASGQTAFFSFITGGSNDQGIFRSDSGSTLTAIARAGSSGGDNAPGAGGGTFSSLGSPVLNDNGQTAFFAGVTGGTNTQGIFRSDSGNTVTAIARLEQSAPGAGGGTFSGLSSNPVLNASGQTAFSASITGGSNTQGIFRSSSGSTLTAIARLGQSAPGAGGGTFSSLSSPVLNDGGQTAFRSSITGGTSTQGIFLADGRETVAVQLQGAALAGKTVSSLFSPSRDGLNNFGQVAYQANFTDGTSGLFRFTPALRWRESFGSSWDTASNWTLGIAPGSVHDVTLDPSATLSVTGPTGAVTVRSLVVGSGTGFATLALNGGSIGAASAVQIGSRGILAGNGSLAAEVVNAGEVRADNLILSGGLTNNGTVRGAATGNQRIDTNLTNNAAGLVRVGSGELLKLTGTTHSNSGLVETRSGGELQVGGNFTNAATGQVLVDGAVARFSSAVTNASGGRINLNDGTAFFTGGLANNGRVQVTFGESQVFGAVTTNSGGKVILSGNSNTTFYDTFDVKSGGELSIASAASAVFFGQVFQRTGALFTGTGTKYYEGGFSPGSSPGAVSDEGSVFFTGGNAYLAEIGGVLPGAEHDALSVAGTLGFGGTLKLVSWDGFTGQVGQRFDLFDWGTASGRFGSIDASGLLLAEGTVLDFSQLYVDGSVSVTAVPEPASWALMLAGMTLGGVHLRRRRKD